MAKPPAAPTVSGPLVWAALQTGISKDPAPTNPYTDDRRVHTEEGYYLIGGTMTTYSLARSPWGPIMVDNRMTVSPVGSGDVIDSVVANGMTLSGPPLDLRNVNPTIDATAATWSNGEWFASLVIQRDQPGRIRVCWNAHLPPPEPVYGPPDVPPAVRPVPFKRLMCGIYSETQVGPDVGGYMIDDFGGTIRTFRGEW